MFLSRTDLLALSETTDELIIKIIINKKFWSWYDENKYDVVIKLPFGIKTYYIKDIKHIFVRLFGAQP